MKKSGIVITCPAGKFIISSDCEELCLPLELQITYAILLRLSLKYGFAWPSQDWLSEQMQRSVRTVRNYIARLRRLGLISVRRRGWGFTSLYFVLRPDDAVRVLAAFEATLGTATQLRSEPPIPADIRRLLCKRISFSTQPAKQIVASQPTQRTAQAATAGTDRCLMEEAKVAAQITSNTKTRNYSSPLPPNVPSTVRSTFASPSPQTVAQTNPDRGGAYASFEELWAVWPLKQDRKRAYRAYCHLLRTRQLPSLSVLLATTRQLKDTDVRWQRGMVPLLAVWLRGQRWHDQPFTGAVRRSTPNKHEVAELSLRAERERYLVRDALYHPDVEACGDAVTRCLLAARGGLAALRAALTAGLGWLQDDHGFLSEYLERARHEAVA